MKIRYLSVAGALLLSMFLSVAIAVAATYVNGKVVDSNGNPLVGAEVYATCNGVTQGPVLTNDQGNYGFDFTGICETGDTVFVEATYNGNTGSNSGMVEDFIVVQIATVDVSIDIPEFTTIAIPAILTLGGYLATRRRKVGGS
jgi:hypothetical protein